MKNVFRHLSPQQVLPLSFLGFVLFGVVLLVSPWATRDGGMSIVDALFTATSAVCVTGLIVVDTGTYFTPFGQGVILGLIQVGGLGIMTFSVLFYRLLGTGISLRDRIIVQSSFSPLNKGDVLELVRSIFIYTFLIEATGTLLLFFGWPGGSVSWRCLWVAIFHSVSAFCNAGFSLFSDSLMSFQSNWWVNVIITSLIICGGLGFVVLTELVHWAKKRLQQERHARLSLHSKIVLATTGSLILGGTLLFLMLEFNNSLVTVPLHGKILASYFQSVTARTAGFNTVNLYNLANPTLFVLIILMFIGASPGSCGGGVKTINAAILVIMAKNRFKGREEGEVFKRTIPRETLSRSVTIILSSVVLISVVACLVMIAETGGYTHSETRGKFLEYLFETVSAFGTVGLSMGVTSTLTTLGKILIMIMMFLGRLGPLNLAFSLAKRTPVTKFQYGEEKVFIG
ncbi:MAG: hypothetical protein DRG63_02620 [Deltaproteobacteria bacterium]|nr:MAG: hypothetical protein DRG63_02620 [Deltaproteobacteria bacterium]